MALDGILLRALSIELNQMLKDARISKIQQPEPYELLILFRTPGGQKKLLLSANASLPLAYLTEESKQSPKTAPNFCMLLRKHIGSARVIGVTQKALERVLDIKLEHLDELNDLQEKHLIIELMGKYSNIIFTDADGVILDAIRHVTPAMSSVRTVLPGYPYFVPDTQHKKDALSETREGFLSSLRPQDTLADAIARNYTGFSYPAVQELLFGGGLDAGTYVSSLNPDALQHFADLFTDYTESILSARFSPVMALSDHKPSAFSAMPMPSYEASAPLYEMRYFRSVSELLETFFRERNLDTNLKNRAQGLRKQAEVLLERASKKADLQEKQLEDAGKRERFRLYGELLTAYAYQLPVGVPEAEVLNYYTGETLRIPVDPDLSISDNAGRYYAKYAKLKRTDAALQEQIRETRAELSHLQSIVSSIDLAESPEDLLQIRREMEDAGYIRRQSGNRKEQKIVSAPRHYISSDGFHLYAGRNNTQNDWLTMKFADGCDYFFHAKNVPGAHVILKTENREVPDRAFEEAASLAAYCSSGRSDPKVEIDYVLKKEVKKPAGAKPGFVIYHTNYSMTVPPDIRTLREAGTKGDA